MSLPSLIDVQAADSVEAAAAKITLPHEVIFLLLGDFDASIAAQVRSLCARAVIPVALMADALVLDMILENEILENEAGQGLAAQLGQAAAQMDQSPPLLGIVGPGIVPGEINHTHLLEMLAAWGDPAKAAILMIAELAKGGAAGQRPVVVVLFGGTEADTITVLRCARRYWPILIVRGAGGLGDKILAAQKTRAEGEKAPVLTDPDLREILDTGTVCPLDLDGNVDDLRRVLLGPIQTPGDALVDAWRWFDDLDCAAIEKQSQFRRMQNRLLLLAVISTLLAILLSKEAYPSWIAAVLPSYSLTPVAILRLVLHVCWILIPITITALAGFNSHFREGNKWILLRAAAETIKREIFRFRTRTGTYAEAECVQTSAQSKLVAKVTDITSNLLKSEVNKSSLPRRPKTRETQMSFMKPEEYVVERIEDQIAYFTTKNQKLYNRLKRFQLLILVAGGGGTLLAIMNWNVWVALTTALATAFTAKLETDQTENSIVQYNMALVNLRNVESWWKALSQWEKARFKNIDLLVSQTEMILERETGGWVQQMQSELDKLTERQKSPDQSSNSTSAK